MVEVNNLFYSYKKNDKYAGSVFIGKSFVSKLDSIEAVKVRIDNKLRRLFNNDNDNDNDDDEVFRDYSL